LGEEVTLNITTLFLGVIGVALIGPLALAAVMAGVMTWLSRQLTAGAPAVPSQPAPAVSAEPQPQFAGAQAELAEVESIEFEREETHHRLVPVWLAVVYAVIILWALLYVLTRVISFFKPLAPQSAPVVAPTATGAPGATRSPAYSGKGNAANGEKLFAAQGCSACHSLKEGEKIIGPSLYHIGQAAAERVKSADYRGKAKTAEEYLRESIVEPNADIAPGYPAGVMLQDFGKKLNAQDLDDLVAFLVTK
jgi:cytochrome c2